MPFTQLFVWVEGPDDERFARAVFQPLLGRRFDFVQVIPYAGMTKVKVVKWIESIRAIDGANYIFCADCDEHPCVSQKKDELTNKLKSLQAQHTVILVKEIESWYLAGLTDEGRQRLGIEHNGGTNHVDKEAFDQLRVDAFDSRVEWMIEMLRHYSLELGIQRNTSLEYFAAKYLS